MQTKGGSFHHNCRISDVDFKVDAGSQSLGGAWTLWKKIAASRVGEVLVQAPWEGRFSNHQTRNGISVPFAGKVAWMRPQGRKTYFKGAVTHLSHAAAP